MGLEPGTFLTESGRDPNTSGRVPFQRSTYSTRYSFNASQPWNSAVYRRAEVMRLKKWE